MTSTVDVLDTEVEALAPPRAATPLWRRFRIGNAVVPVFAGLAFVFLLVPIAYTVAFSFNDYKKSNLIWRGFTWKNWENPCGSYGVCEAFATSLQVSTTATAGATVLGTLLAVALVRVRFRGRSAINMLIFLPMCTPEVVLGSALAAQFLMVRATYGFWTIVAAHVLFCISFVVVTVKARVASLDPALEEAAADLYASPLVAFFRVTFPLLLPGIAAAALLSFSLSFDDYIVTNFNAGSVKTFPMFVYISANRGIPAQANVLATIMFLLALSLVVITQVLGATRRRRREVRPARAARASAGSLATATSQPAPERPPARPPRLVVQNRPQVPAATPTTDAVTVAGLSLHGHRPFAVAAVGMGWLVGSVVAVLVILLLLPNAEDADLGIQVVTLFVAVVSAVVAAVVVRGEPVARYLAVVWLGLALVGFLRVRHSWTTIDRPAVAALVVAAVSVGLLFTPAANHYFGPLRVARHHLHLAKMPGVAAVLAAMYLGLDAVGTIARVGAGRWLFVLLAAIVLAAAGIVLVRARTSVAALVTSYAALAVATLAVVGSLSLV